jgi:hypothetical protein
VRREAEGSVGVAGICGAMSRAGGGQVGLRKRE